MILLLDNYDSFVHNLARYFRRLGHKTEVLRSDEVDAETCLRMNPNAVVFSPGPKGPADTGCCIDLLHQLPDNCPVLGICLGHQAIAAAFGAVVERCEPMHGMSSRVTHRGAGLFKAIPNPMIVGRYHSLAVLPESLPSCLEVLGTADDGTVMALRHRERPIYGLQFHPESVLTEYGSLLLRNFISEHVGSKSVVAEREASHQADTEALTIANPKGCS